MQILFSIHFLTILINLVRIELNKMVFKESENIELQSVVIDDIKKEIIAFANCKGGILYIGVEYDGSFVVLNRKKRL